MAIKAQSKKTTNTKTLKCRGCQTTKDVAAYIIADDIEHPRCYCKKCIREIMMRTMMQDSLMDYKHAKPKK